MVFGSAGGNGHSRTNLLYWIATRDPGIEAMATPSPSAAPRAPQPTLPKLPDCVDGPGLAAARSCPPDAPHVCFAGPARGGCASTRWTKPACLSSCKRLKWG